ncbi:MAG: carboxymuconolactone decarboxylase family protein [Methanoregulaceae archaeon]|nr:carboxymuconolactone decarboxylase family protein [Methanoregulaceae archaeon]
MKDYDDTIQDIKSTLGFVPGYMKVLPEDILVKEWPLLKRYSFGESKIPAKYRELIGLAVAAALRCPYCQYTHRSRARALGANDREIAEISALAGITSGWSAMIHAQGYDIELFKKETAEINSYIQKKGK